MAGENEGFPKVDTESNQPSRSNSSPRASQPSASAKPDLLDLVESAFGESKPDPSTAIVPPPTARTQPPVILEDSLERPPETRQTSNDESRSRSDEPPKPRPWWHALGIVLIAAGAGAGGYLLVDKLASSMFGYSPAEALVMTLQPPVNAVDVAPRAQPSLPPEERSAIDLAPQEPGDSPAQTTLSDRPTRANRQMGDSNSPAEAAEGFEHPTVIEVYDSPLAEPGGLFDRVRLISWKETPDGAMVTIWGNGPARADDIVLFRIDGEQPRELIKLRGIDLAFPRPTMEPDIDAISRIRTGFHPKPVANELHIVFDLTAPDIRLDRVQTDGSRIHLFLTRG